MKKPSIVQLLHPNGYLAFLRWADNGAGHAECVHIAQIHHPTSGGVAAYVKIYPPTEPGTKGMVNEIIGYLVAEGCGLPRSPFAFVVGVPLDKLPIGGPTWIRDILDLGRADRRELPPYLAFCTAAVDGVSAFQSLGDRDSALLRQDILKWADLPRVLAFDDGIANIDRHYNNLIRVGKHRYTLIDHGQLIAPLGNWTCDNLEPHGLYRHRLLELLYPNGEIPEKVRSAVLLEASKLREALSRVEVDLKYWLSRFLPPDEATAYEVFLRERMLNIEDLLRKRYNLLA